MLVPPVIEETASLGIFCHRSPPRPDFMLYSFSTSTMHLNDVYGMTLRILILEEVSLKLVPGAYYVDITGFLKLIIRGLT